MLAIRLSRTGRRNLANYRIVVAEKSAPVKGKFLEVIGHYNPISTPKQFVAKTDRIEYWISKGAKPSPTLASLTKKYLNMAGMDKYLEAPTRKLKSRKEAAAGHEGPPPAIAEEKKS